MPIEQAIHIMTLDSQITKPSDQSIAPKASAALSDRAGLGTYTMADARAAHPSHGDVPTEIGDLHLVDSSR